MFINIYEVISLIWISPLSRTLPPYEITKAKTIQFIKPNGYLISLVSPTRWRRNNKPPTLRRFDTEEEGLAGQGSDLIRPLDITSERSCSTDLYKTLWVLFTERVKSVPQQNRSFKIHSQLKLMWSAGGYR